MIDEAVLQKSLEEQLPTQRWFGASKVTALESARELEGKLIQAIVRGDDGARYQAIVGVLDDGSIVDATSDQALSLALFRQAMPDEEVSKVRPLGAEQTNTSLVFDERLVLKVFRRLSDGPNPDVDVTKALADIGFEHVIAPVGLWRDGDDYAVVNELLASSVDGWQLALTSLRDLYDRRCPPSEAPGDFGFEAERLGRVTAELHVAMGDAFGTSAADIDAWIGDMEAQLARVDLPSKTAKQARSVYQSLRDVEPGPAIRVHGDYHLGQTLSADAGWFVLDFEGEPARPLEERSRPSSPMQDVAGMLRSLGYAAQVALREIGATEDEDLQRLGGEWERHNVERFLAGYDGYAEIDRVLPPTEARHVVRRAFELDKAVYEIAYEEGHRPDWVEIPMAAVHRILGEVA
ncbi:MAG TPA: phosphotransferase [Acidimicrobiales bacterium]|nr:phosphotransferase [Acidimicrobiales bacterium]